MTPERAKELLPIIQACAEGKTIQFRLKLSMDDWNDMPDDPMLCQTFPASDYEYRIKPEPKVIYVNEYSTGILNAFESHEIAVKAAGSCDRVAVKYQEIE